MSSITKIVLLHLSLLTIVKCSRLLVVFPMAARSHYNLGSGLAKQLAEAGHDVTIISPFKEKTPPKNGKYREIVLTGFIEKREEENMNMFEFGSVPAVVSILIMNGVGNDVTERTFAHPNVQKLLNDKTEHFDAVIVEQFVNDAMKVFAYHFKAPLVLFSTVGPNAWVNPLVGNPSPPSYIPDIFLSFSSRMTFCERVVNTLVSLVSELNRHLYFFPSQNKILKNYFPDAPDLSVLNYNASLILLNSHVSTNQPVPLVPNMINIGGFHVTPPKPLPKHLKEFIDGSTEGVIYFSMGSNLKSKDMPKKVIDNILQVFGKLPQRIIWKFEDDNLEGLPKNVMIGKWLPQSDILAHPNVKLFITHGGLLSTTETIYHGVPVLAIPIFGDQKMNAAQIVLNGFGLSLSFSDFDNQNKLSSVIQILLNDQKYRNNAKTRSNILHDQPLKPIQNAEFWIEYVIRHKGAVHLRNAGIELKWYQYLLIDVWAFVISVTFVILYVLTKIVKCLCKCGKTKTDVIKKKQ